MQRVSDIDINAAVRRVLVRHWIDIGYVQVRTCRGVTTLGGALQRLAATGSELTGGMVEQMAQEISRIRGVRRVQFQFQNWSNQSALWQPTPSAGSQVDPPVRPEPPSHGS